MDTTVLNFGLLMLAFVFCILLGFIHKTTQGKIETIAQRNYNQKWCFAQILLGVVFVFVVIILGIFAALKGSPTLKSMFEYVFVSSVDAILVLLFSFLCFLLLVKEDSPLRQTMPSEYFNLQEYGKEDQEDEIGLQSAAASMCEGASQAGSQVERKTVLYCFNLFIFKLKNSLNLSSICTSYQSPYEMTSS
jgi:magnesium-transporting ATPase (P-type)